MMKQLRTLAVGVALVTMASAVGAEEQPRWGYHGDVGSANWGKLDEAYTPCAEGKAQSPINITEFVTAELESLTTNYDASEAMVLHHGHTIHVDIPEGNRLNLGDTVYHLKQLHFHTPSEHYLDGSPYSMEIHFLHRNDKDELAVIGVMLEVGEANEAIDTIWNAIPESGEAGNKIKLSADQLLPDNLDYFAYDGSLTMPPCTEGVKWHMLQEPITLSREQLVAFQTLFPVNARPIQPLNGRTVEGTP